MLLFLHFFLFLFSLCFIQPYLAKKTFPTIHSNVIPSLLYISNTSWKFVGLFVKHPEVMSFKCRRTVGSSLYQKMKSPKLYSVLKKIITKWMTYTQSATKSISLFNIYECLKSLPLFTVHFLLVTRSRCFQF